MPIKHTFSSYVHGSYLVERDLESKWQHYGGYQCSNVVVVELMQVPIVMVFSVFIPSLFKFVTGSPDTSVDIAGDGGQHSVQVGS